MNIFGLVLQLFVVSRVVKHFGDAVGGDGPAGPVARRLQHPRVRADPVGGTGAKVAENSTDYSLNNTVRNMLFLPCTHEQKFSAKQAIDSFFVRMGDVLSAVLVFLGTTMGAAAARLRRDQRRAGDGLARARVARRTLLRAADHRRRGADRVGYEIAGRRIAGTGHRARVAGG